jgi:hypothetical protein
MKQNYSSYRGKVSGANSDMYDFGIERYYDLLREAEESRRAPITLPLPQTTTKAKPATRSFRQLLASLL